METKKHKILRYLNNNLQKKLLHKKFFILFEEMQLKIFFLEN